MLISKDPGDTFVFTELSEARLGIDEDLDLDRE
jgi:hypothetical protein